MPSLRHRRYNGDHMKSCRNRAKENIKNKTKPNPNLKNGGKDQRIRQITRR